ncbi:polysaccharide deacetylase family protein [Streptococcus sp. zg-JUN1979]|uniref:polysaccharide deacetylase family protein n=1 Tax=Streptococcus sp. zg-JUN1979 TaxID=3391450 RepID=UPI0039A48766
MSTHHRHQQKSKKNKPIVIILGLVLLGCLVFQAYLLTHAGQLKKSVSTAKTSVKTSTSQSSQAKAKEMSWERKSDPVQIPILMYHAIHVMDPSEVASANLIVDPAVFDSHIKRLKDEGYYFLTPEEAYKALEENSLPTGVDKVVWLTFDDGNADFYTQAYPILKEYGVKATNNIITGFVEEERASNVTVEQMREMKEHGMSFQSHTQNHPDLSSKDSLTQAQEMTESKAYLDDVLAQETIALAYPSGRYNQLTEANASDIYKLAVTTNEGLAEKADGLLSLDRVRVLPGMTADDLLLAMGDHQ